MLIPDIIKLSKKEYFQGKNIEVRGKRNISELYFRVKDVSAVLDIPNLQQLLVSSTDKKYYRVKDYDWFEIHLKKCLFITYYGLKRVLTELGSTLVQDFEDWIRVLTRPINKGTGAGGKNTNVSGLSFEKKTDNRPNLTKFGFVEKNGFLSKNLENREIIFLPQSQLQKYFKNCIQRKPDEAYLIISDQKELVIVEKKCQNVEGSVKEKLYAAPLIREEYQEYFPEYKISYLLCVNSFLEKKLNSNKDKLKILLQRHNIPILYGDHENYFDQLNQFLQLK